MFQVAQFPEATFPAWPHMGMAMFSLRGTSKTREPRQGAASWIAKIAYIY